MYTKMTKKQAKLAARMYIVGLVSNCNGFEASSVNENYKMKLYLYL